MTISIFTTDANLIVRSWDDWLASVTGLSAEKVCGVSLANLVPDLETRGILAYFQRVLKNGRVETLSGAVYPYLFQCPTVKPSLHFEFMQQRVTIAPLQENSNSRDWSNFPILSAIGVVVTVEDVTAQLDLQKDLSFELDNPDELVRLRAAQALATAHVLEPEPMLVKALGDSSWRVRRAAVDSLAQQTGGTIATSLLRSLREEHRNPGVLNAVLQVLKQSKVDIVPALIDCLNSEDVDLRIYAALALGEQNNPARRDLRGNLDRRAIPALIRALEDTDANVRYHAIDALGNLNTTLAVEPLMEIAESGDFFLAFPALDALTRIGDGTVTPRMLPLLEDELLCVAVVGAIGQLGDASVVPALARLLNKAGTPVAEIAAAIASLYDRYERLYREGNYIAALAASYVDTAGVQNLVDAVQWAKPNELRALVLLLGQTPGNTDRNVESVMVQLLGHPTVRYLVMEALVRYGKRVTDLLIEQLKAEVCQVREAAVAVLGRIGDPVAVPALTQLLTTDPELTITTAGALAQIGDRRAYDTLLSLMGHPSPGVRQAVVAALNSLGHPDMLTRTIDLLQDKDPHVRESAVKIAGYFAFNECVTLLLERCRDSEEDVRRAAIELIPYLENAPVLPTLIWALENDTPKVRATAARALGQMESPIAYPYLLNALMDGDAWVRYYATRALGTHAYPEAMDTLAQLACSDPATQVRIAAVEALGRVGGPRAVSILASLAEDSSSADDLVRSALMALGEIGHPNSLPPLLSALRSSDLQRRIYSARALGKRGGTGVEAALYSLVAVDSGLFDETSGTTIFKPVPEVNANEAIVSSSYGELGILPSHEPTVSQVHLVQAAIEALAQLSTPEAIAALLELTSTHQVNKVCIAALTNLGEEHIVAIGRGLKHPHTKVRAAAIDVLMRLKHPHASEFLIAALDDKDSSVRLAAINALEHLGNRNAQQKIAVLAHTDPDPTVRRAAQKSQITSV
ncbi:HEAT repeat domain-containing protein [Aerosakkonema funiforme]|uniref:HEAT repeat domain-containing protein n=1 Tax=Aerosakkonema funiforme TaxID=1246630 RepID=UPI0035B7B865